MLPEKTKNKIITIGFVTIIIGILFVNLFKPDKEISKIERRKLTKFPKITWGKLVNGEVTNQLEKYTTDQFVARDSFMSLKSLFSTCVFGQKDNNNLFLREEAIYKMEYPLNENNINKSLDKIKSIYEKYLQGKNVYFSIIPDKNYYLQNDDHLRFDYEKLRQISLDKLEGIKYIDIWEDLSLDDYYRTDLHWKQENIKQVVTKLKNNMGIESEMPYYSKINVGEYYGTYYGQLGLNVKPDQMYILTNETIENCTTYNYETKQNGKVYDNKNSNDKYDIYLSGATPLINIENPNSTNNKELLLFRDSFGSSIAPLLIQDYSKITLIDLRYLSSTVLDKYVEFKDQDVLFLYSTIILNQNVLK